MAVVRYLWLMFMLTLPLQFGFWACLITMFIEKKED